MHALIMVCTLVSCVYGRIVCVGVSVGDCVDGLVHSVTIATLVFFMVFLFFFSSSWLAPCIFVFGLSLFVSQGTLFVSVRFSVLCVCLCVLTCDSLLPITQLEN
eukprot:m.222071 g.222071  ORF g.222071 m.222071 type:complete len:104 (-) comp15953_c0_seq1:27-338(-)